MQSETIAPRAAARRTAPAFRPVISMANAMLSLGMPERTAPTADLEMLAELAALDMESKLAQAFAESAIPREIEAVFKQTATGPQVGPHPHRTAIEQLLFADAELASDMASATALMAHAADARHYQLFARQYARAARRGRKACEALQARFLALPRPQRTYVFSRDGFELRLDGLAQDMWLAATARTLAL